MTLGEGMALPDRLRGGIVRLDGRIAMPTIERYPKRLVHDEGSRFRELLHPPTRANPRPL